MRRKVAGSLVALLLVFAAGAVIVDRLVHQTERALKHVADLHEIERLRQALALEVRRAQSDLRTARSGAAGVEELVP
jgi:flagellar biogenesis protein FliO